MEEIQAEPSDNTVFLPELLTTLHTCTLYRYHATVPQTHCKQACVYVDVRVYAGRYVHVRSLHEHTSLYRHRDDVAKIHVNIMVLTFSIW
jgi:hypothetical protein